MGIEDKSVSFHFGKERRPSWMKKVRSRFRRNTDHQAVSETDLQTLQSTSSDYNGQNSCFFRQISHAPSVAFGEEGTTKYLPTQGHIYFWKNFAYETEGHPFLTTTHDTNIEEISNVLQNKWRIKNPRIVLVVISNVTSHHDWKNSRQLENFQKGLIKAANATDMWIITHGINVGITKVIGDAVHQEQLRRKGLKCHKHPNQNRIKFLPLNLIGIIREDFLIYGDLFDGRMDRIEIENEGNCPEENKYELNPDHSHYIIVRDNSINKTGINHFLLHLEQYMVCAIETPNQRNEDDISTLGSNEIPVVALLIQGGYNCARLVLEHLKKQLPVVVLYGSGGLADLLAHAYYEVQYRLQGCWDAEFVENSLKPDLTSKITRNFPKLRDNNLARNIFRDRILECVRQSHQNTQVYLTILNLHGHSVGLENLDEHLLCSLFKAQRPERLNWHANMRKDLYLTLDWNTPHVATSEVFMKDPSNKFRIDKVIFDEALLRPNREEFVDLFLNQSFKVHKYLTPRRLKMIFQKAQKKEFFQSVCWEGVLGHGMETKLGKYFVEKDLNWLIEHVTGIPNFVNAQELSLNAMGMYASDPAAAERKALTVLIMWSVFTNRPKLCKLLWKHSDQPVHVALIVSMIYDRLSSYVHEMGMKSEMMDLSRQFADMATAVLDASFNDASCRAYDILSEESADWSYKTAVDIAADAKNRTFLSHPCCQKWLTSMFLGKISIRDVTWGVITFPQWLKIILCAFLIFPMYIWIRFKSGLWNTFSSIEDESDDDKDDDDDNEEEINHEKKYVYENSNVIKNEFPFGHGRHRQQVATLLREKEVFVRAPPPIWKMIYWMWNAPITKFWIFQLFYMFYLGLFSFAVLAPSCGILTLDIIVCSWTFLIAIENIRRVYILFKKYSSVPLFLKCVEILLIITFVILYVLGRIVNVGIFLKPYNGKILLCVGLLYFYYRLIAIYLPISPTLGPLLYRVKLMVLVDFVNFMRMTMLVIISGGIVIQASLYPDYPLNTELFRRAFHRAWFSLFITPIDELQGREKCREPGILNNASSCSNIGKYKDEHCPNDGLWPYIFSIQYFVLLKLILLTLLYALFSATASKLQLETDAIWKFQRYQLVVDFVNRSCLPPPLCVIGYLYIAVQWIIKCITCAFCRKQDQVDSKYSGVEDKTSFPEKDYNYWRQLAQDYLSKEEEKEEDKLSKQLEVIMNVSEDVEYQKKIMKQLKGRIRELEHSVRITQVYLESIKHIAEKHEDHVGLGIQILSRHSPYPGTRIQRFPVPDKYVPWEVMWTDYDPIAYTKPISDFPIEMQSYVDEDILLIYEGDKKDQPLPVLQWNTVAVNVAGIYTNRKSWMVDSDGISLIYKLDSENLPQNPMGRCGIRGKGALPRWGPNHYIYIIITRWQRSKMSIAGGKGLEVIVMKNEKSQITLPGSFVAAENQYQAIINLFKVDKDSKWQNKDDMLQFFQACISSEKRSDSECPGMKGQQLQLGYMDDPWNTDQAWREVELWHIHYFEIETINEKLQSSLFWRLITEDIFMKLPAGQAQLLQEVTHNLQPSII